MLSSILKQLLNVFILNLIIFINLFSFGFYKICLDPGHGGNHGGTDGYKGWGPNEKEKTRELCLLTTDFLYDYKDWFGQKKYDITSTRIPTYDTHLSVVLTT